MAPSSPLVLLFLFLVTASATKYWLYAGAGGCDSDDPTCKQPPPVDLSTLYIIDYDSTTGSMNLSSKLTGYSPLWLRVHPSNKYLLVVDREGGVASLSINANTGALTLVNKVQTPGGTVHFSVDTLGDHLFVASYGSGTIGVCSISAKGELGVITSSRQFYGHGTNPVRQDAPHPHSINVDPRSAGRFVFIPDLGLDIVFSFEVVNGIFRNTSFTNTTTLYPGAGPRHMAFHPTLPLAFVLSEMGSTISTFKLDSTVGQLLLPPLQTIKTLPQDFTGFSKAAEVLVDPSGKWLLASNRGFDTPSNSITVFEISAATSLVERGRFSYGGKFPRGVALDPEGKTLIVGGQDSNNIVSMKFDVTTGVLTPSGFNLQNIATPVAFEFVEQM